MADNHRRLTDDQAREIADLVMYEAKEIWIAAECPDDFCVQHYGWTAIVFGGTNRVQWSVRNGFRVDRSYCTARFLEAFDKRFPGGRDRTCPTCSHGWDWHEGNIGKCKGSGCACKGVGKG